MNKKEKISKLIEKYKDVPNIEEIINEARKIEIEEFDKNHKPLYDLDDYKEYNRHLILMRPDTALLMHIFRRDLEHNFEDAWLDDNDSYAEKNYEVITESAHQFMLQLEGHYCIAFLEALKEEIDNVLKHNYAEIEKIKTKHDKQNKDTNLQ